MKLGDSKYAFLMFAGFLLSGCGGGGTDDVRQWMETVKKETRINVPKLSVPKVY